MSHNDYIEKVAPGFDIVAHTLTARLRKEQDHVRKLYCVQFHPEVLHTDNGTKMLSNFVYIMRLPRHLENGFLCRRNCQKN